MGPSPTSTALYPFFHDGGQEETTRIGPNKKTNNMLITASKEEEESDMVERKGTISTSICTALDKKNEQHQQHSPQRRKLLLGGVPPMHQMLDKEQQQQQQQRQQDQQQEEEIDLKSFRAKLEQNLERSNSCSYIVVNLDDYFKQQRIKKFMDLKKKTEASNFLQSYKNADVMALSKQVVSHQKSPVSAAGGDVENEFACQVENAMGDLSMADAQHPMMNMNKVDEYGSDHGRCDVHNHNNNDNNNNGSIDASILDNGPEEEKLQHKHIDIDETKTAVLCKRMEKEVEQKVATDDISMSISTYKHLLAPPPKRNYRKLFLSSCWCSD